MLVLVNWLIAFFDGALAVVVLWWNIEESRGYKRRLAEDIRNCPCAEHARLRLVVSGENSDREYEEEAVKFAKHPIHFAQHPYRHAEGPWPCAYTHVRKLILTGGEGPDYASELWWCYNCTCRLTRRIA